MLSFYRVKLNQFTIFLLLLSGCFNPESIPDDGETTTHVDDGSMDNSGGSASHGGMSTGGGSSDEGPMEGGDSTDSSSDPSLVLEEDVYVIKQGETLSIEAEEGVLRNDVDELGGMIHAVEIDAQTRQFGSVRLTPDGAFTFSPAVPGWWGEDSFIYEVETEDGRVGSARVRIIVRPRTIDAALIASGIGGFVVAGNEQNARSGTSVSGAGDVNGDGLDDIIIGAPEADFNGEENVGRSYVVFGKTNTIAVSLEQIAAGVGGFVINGEGSDNRFGESVSGAGDVNGDGLDDVVIGASGVDSESGRGYVVFGRVETTPISAVQLVSGMGGFILIAENDNDHVGVSVSGAGDVNHDGLDDVIVGAPEADPGGSLSGRSYVVFGRRNDTSSIGLSTLASSNQGFAIDGASLNLRTGTIVASAGDMNGDDFADVIVGSDSSSTTVRDESYVVFGKAGTSTVTLDFEEGLEGFSIRGELVDDRAGRSINKAGDVDGDGVEDLVAGAIRVNGNGTVFTGRAYVIRGEETPTHVELEDVAGGSGGQAFNGEEVGDFFGRSVGTAGDVNGDGLADVIIGADGANQDDGRGYVIFGSHNLSLASVDDVLDGEGGFVINGETQGDGLGRFVRAAGDVNGDGFGDVVVGAEQANVNDAVNAGRSYVIFGGDFSATDVRESR